VERRTFTGKLDAPGQRGRASIEQGSAKQGSIKQGSANF
jgi:hypothetical protein